MVQFSVSIILITGTIIIGNQMSYIRSKNLGYDKDHVLSCNLNEMNKHFEVVKTELIKEPGISHVTAASINIIRYGGHTGDNWWEGKETGETLTR